MELSGLDPRVSRALNDEGELDDYQYNEAKEVLENDYRNF
jgi:hypothetical protein